MDAQANATAYPQMISSVIYLRSVTRLNLAYIIVHRSQYSSDPTEEYFFVSRHLL